MADFLAFSTLVPSSPSLLLSAGVAVDDLVMVSIVDQWAMRRTSFLLHHFLFQLLLPQTFFWRCLLWLVDNEKDQPSSFHNEAWKFVSWKYALFDFSSSSSTPKWRERWSFTWELFSFLSLNYFKCSGVIAVDISLGIEWANLWVLGLINGLKPFLFTFLLPQIIGSNGFWAFRADSWGFGFGLP